MSLLKDIWSVLTPQQRQRVAVAQLLSIAMALSTVAGIAAIAPLFSVLGNPRLIHQNTHFQQLYQWFGFSTPRSFELALGFGFMALVLLSNLLNLAGSFALSKLAVWIGADLQSALLRQYLARPYSFYVGTHSALLANKVIHETARSTNEVLQNLFSLITNLATGVLIVTSIVVLNPLMAVLLILLLIGGYACIYFAVQRGVLLAGEAQSYLFAEQGKIIDETFAAIKEILVLHVQDYFRIIFERHSRQLAHSGAKLEFIAKSPRHLMECLAVCGLVAAALVAEPGDAGIGSRLGQLTFLGFAAYRLLPTLQQSFACLIKIRAGQNGFGSIVPDLLQARKSAVHKVMLGRDGWPDRPLREIRLERISYRYDAASLEAIRNVTIRIPARTAVGIVGANGAGKTTLVDLIAGLLVPHSGHVAIDDIVVDEGNRAQWQTCIAYVPQHVTLLDASIEENIALGCEAGAIDRRQLDEAAHLAQLDRIVNGLPGGYQFRVGEKGVRLSGGQRQRIGIARALYRNASVLIMDEATSAQDGLSEQELMTTLLQLRGRYTLVLIAHRMSAARVCDTLVELKDGAVVGSGTYEELLSASLSFRRLAGAH